MIKNCIIMLMVFVMISSAWCCGVRAINVNQGQNQVNNNNNNNPQPNIVNVSFQEPAPAPVPRELSAQEKIIAEIAKAQLPQNTGDNVAPENNAGVVQVVEEFVGQFNLNVAANDTDESRVERNERQIRVIEEVLNPLVNSEIIPFVQNVNTIVAQFSNDPAVAGAPQSVIDNFFGQVSNIYAQAFTDLGNVVRVELGNNQDPSSFINIVQEDGSNSQQTTDDTAIIADGTGSALPSIDNVITGLNVTTDQFIQDLTFVKNTTIDEIENFSTLDSNSESGINRDVDSALDSALDTSFRSPTQTSRIRFDVLDPQNFNSSRLDQVYSIVSIVTAIRDRFPSGSSIRQDLQFFLDVFPPSSEVAVQDSLTPGDDLFANQGTNILDLENQRVSSNDSSELADFDPNQQDNSFVTSSFTVGADGRLVGVDTDNDSQEFQDISSNATRITRSFNSRQFGGNNGSNDSVQITIGDRAYVLHDHVFTSPLVLDMDGNGKLEASNGIYLPHTYKDGKVVEFDIDGDGFVDLTEWVGKNDGLLIQYDASEPVSGKQLFGDCDGFINGYEKLRSLDANEDGVINGQELSTLSVWQDKNQNAKVDSGEIKSLSDLNITELSVEHDNFVSQFVMDGKEMTMWDWYPSTFFVKKRK